MLNGRVERLELALVTLVAAASPPARRPLVGPVPTDEEAESAWPRVVARELLAIAQREGRQRPWCAGELLGDELLDETQAAASSAADDALCARWLAAQGQAGWRVLDERKQQIVEQRRQLLLAILNEIAATLVEPYLGQVLADVERKALTSPISVHLNVLAWKATWTRTGEESPYSGYHGPLAMPEAICQVLVEHPEGAGEPWADCGDCGLVIPDKRFDRFARDACCILTLHTCPYCGGSDIGPHRYWDRHRERARVDEGVVIDG